MAARANWKGYLRLSLVSCPIALYPATTESEKVRFHQLNRNTGHRIRYRKVDDETGEEVESEDIIKAYQISKGKYVEITDEDLEAVAVESTRTIEIDKFVPRQEIDDLYNIRPYFIAPEGKIGAEAKPRSRKRAVFCFGLGAARSTALRGMLRLLALSGAPKRVHKLRP